jgi:HSP20 family protein
MTSLIRRNPFEELSSLLPRDFFYWPRDLFSKLAPDGGLAVEWSPRCDMTETEDEIIVHAELPGVDTKDMEVSVREGMLYVRGEKRTEKKEEEKGRTYSERFFGSFERALSIPANVDEEKIEARLKDGVLEVHMPKVAPSKPAEKKIAISAN